MSRPPIDDDYLFSGEELRARGQRRVAKRVSVLAAVGALLALFLTGCSGSGDRAGEGSSRLHERTIELTDGRTVTCVLYRPYQGGGLSCDWGGAE